MSWSGVPLALVLALVAVIQSQAFPVGMNLSPLGGGFQGIQFTPVSTYAFSDLFKHCTSFVIRSTMDGIKNNIGYQPNSAVSWQSTGFPASLPYTNAKTFFFAMCDVGYGGRAIRPGVYNVSWTGTGDVGFGNDVNGVNATILARQNNSLLVRMSLPTTSSPDATPTGLNVRLLRSAAQDPVTQLSIIPVELTDPVIAHKPKQVFHPDFLVLFRGFDHIRFTQWSRLTNGGSQTKLWASRTLPTTVSQHGNDGVAIEHMVDLLRETNVTSAWFSFPTASDDYNAKMLTLLRDTIPRRASGKPFKLYIEAGSAESHGNTDRKAESLALFAAAQRVFQGLEAYFNVVPSTSIYYREYTPYVINWFGSSFSVLKAIAVPAQFGRGMDRGIHYDGYATWDLHWANYTVPEILKEIHHSSLQADFILNDMYQKLLAQKTSFEFVAWTGGPFFTAQPYAARYAKNILEGCISKNTYPCVWANTKMNVPNATEAQKLLPVLRVNATMEQRVEDLLIAVQRSPELYDIYLDFLRRWEMLGGGLMMSNTLLRPAQRCLTGAASCGSDGIFEEPADITRCIAARANNTIVSHPAVERITPCQKLWPLLDYKAGLRSALPYTANDLPQTVEQQCGGGCQWGTCDNGQCVCFAGYTGVDCSVLQTNFHRRNQCNNDTGVNMAGIADWSTEIPFVDLFLSSRAWISQDFPATAWSTGTKQYLRPDGYPANLTTNQKVGTLMVRDLRGHFKAGVYTVLYDGDGVLSFGMDVQTVYRSVGRIEIYVQPSTGLNNGIFLMIERTNPADPIRNIRVITPGYEDKYKKFPFNPFFLENLRPFKALRFMDWMSTNVDVFSGEWSDRTILNVNARGFVGNAGVSLEYMVLLANTLGTDAWFNIPHRATDDFVRRFAEYVKTHLRPDVKVYIEYSNEVWGTLFPGGQYCQNEGLKRGLSTNADTARFCFNMLRSNEIFNIWKDIYGASLASTRLEFVLNSQYVNPDVTKQLLACTSKLATHPVYSSVPLIHTAIAIAPYFGDYKPTRDKDLKLFLNTTLPAQIRGMASTVAGHNAVTQPKGLKLLTYESGTGFAGSGTDDDLVIQAVRSPEMTSLYVQYYDMLRANGVRLMLAFTSTEAYSTSRSWGQLESSDQNPLSAPKYQGLLSYINAHSTCSAQTKQAIAAAERSARGFTCANDCSQSGLCVAQDTCECYYGSSGAMCDNAVYTEHRDLCGYYCGFWQGECVVDYIAGGTDRYWKCECHDNYYGPQCTLFDCEANCNYNGQCLDANVCHCFPGYTGAFCDIDCGCDGHGMCASNVTAGQPTCVCDVGFVWSEAEKKCASDMRLPHTSSLSVEANNNNNNTSCSLSCEYGHCVCTALVAGGVRDTCQCWAGYTGSLCETPEPATETRTRSNAYSLIGANLGDITYYTTEPAFVDAMKMSSDWISVYASGYTQASDAYAFGNGQPIHLRSDGYPSFLEPGQNLVKMMLRDVHKHAVIAGRYVCLFDGEGVIDFNFDAKVTSIAKNRIEFDFFPTEKVGCTDSYCGDNGILLRLVRTNPLNPVRNIRVLMPGTEHTYKHEPFFRPFLDEIRRYNTLRFMDWMGTNHKREEMLDWSNRITPAHASQAGSVSIEHMVDLCNRLGANPWFNIPHNATDEYVRQFARYVRHTLRPDVRVYLEYSNEVWNTLFPQGKHAQAEGLRLGLSTQPYEAGYRYFAQRSHEIFSIWKEEFAAEIPLEMRKFNGASATAAPTLVRVLSTFTTSSSVTRTLLSWLQHLGGEADAVGVTGYFDCGTIGDSQAATKTETDVHRMCIQGIPRTLAMLDEHRKVIQQANKSLPLVFYEAGQSLVEYKVIAYGNGDNPALTRLFLASNRHPGMTTVYIEYLNAYIANSLISSALPFMQFTSVGVYTKYGSWGVFEFLGQPIESSPKYLALRQYFYYTDPQQMLLRFPQSFQNTVTGATSTNDSTTTDSRYKYIHDFLTTIQANGVVPYEVDISCAVCVSGVSGVNGGTDCNKARIAWNADYLSVGFPHVTSPQRGDVWVAGNAVRHTLTWNVPADYPVTQPAQTVTVRLWKNAFCGLHGSLSHTHNGVLVWDYSAVAVSFASGRFELVLPESVSFDGSETYFFELRGVWYHSYLSEPFTIVRARTTPLVAVSLAPANCSSQSELTQQACTVTQSPRFQSLGTRVLSAHTVGGAEMNQWCMDEYTARTLSNTNTSMRTLPLSSCYTRVSACRLIRTHPKGKPITDCVANISPFPALSSVRERVALTPQAALDYATYLRTIGWQTPLAAPTTEE